MVSLLPTQFSGSVSERNYSSESVKFPDSAPRVEKRVIARERVFIVIERIYTYTAVMGV